MRTAIPGGQARRGGSAMNRQQVAARAAAPEPTKKEEEVLSVAADYFLRHGYRGASINAMARESGISKESIYRYFNSKKDLFEAVIARELEQYQERLHSLDIEFESIALDVALQRIGESILGAVSTDRTLGLRRLIFQEARESRDIGHYYYEVGPKEAYSNLETLFELHRDKAALPPPKLARYFVGMLLHYVMLVRQCGIEPPLSKAEVSRQAAETTRDFLDAFITG